MKYEERIIDKILNTIKEHQVYLTQKENLPQLAKLGYMYNTLFYGGRSASYDGVIPKEELDEGGGKMYYYPQCDENPKYKIEMCDPENEEIENYIYDAWSMHVDNGYGPGWKEFHKIMTEGEAPTPLTSKYLKPNKTFDEWVEIMTDPDYAYSSMFPTRRSVADYLLCVIGNGYGYKNGCVISEAGGADQDTTDYGDWKNAKFRPDIQAIVDSIVNDPEVKKVLEHIEVKKEEYRLKEEAKEIATFGMPYKDWLKSKEGRKIGGILGRKSKYNPYYPICNYSIISKINEKSHPSYLKAAIEICEDILAHEKEESERPENVKFAKNFLSKYKK